MTEDEEAWPPKPKIQAPNKDILKQSGSYLSLCFSGVSVFVSFFPLQFLGIDFSSAIREMYALISITISCLFSLIAFILAIKQKAGGLKWFSVWVSMLVPGLYLLELIVIPFIF